MTGRFRVATSDAAYRLEGEVVRIGADVLVSIWGGERPHIGAVAAAQPRPSLADPAETSATASVLAYVGHKDDVIAKTVAERLAARLATKVVVTAGIHWDNLAPEGVRAVEAQCGELVTLLENGLASCSGR